MTVSIFVELLFALMAGILGAIIGNRFNNGKTLKSILIGFAIYMLASNLSIAIMYIIGLVNPDILKLFTSSTDISIEANVKPNLLKRSFKADKANQKWCTDITYLIYKDKRFYLSSIIDLYDSKIVAYQISRRNDIKIVIDTLNEAIAKRKDVTGLILHSDQGYQYTSSEYKAICISNGIQISMSRKGSPLDNSPIENWHHLKEIIKISTNFFCRIHNSK